MTSGIYRESAAVMYLQPAGKTLMTFSRDGIVTFADDLKPADAAREAWSFFTERYVKPHNVMAEENARLRAALKEIAGQKKTGELNTEYEVECADFEEGYDACVSTARAALGKMK